MSQSADPKSKKPQLPAIVLGVLVVLCLGTGAYLYLIKSAQPSADEYEYNATAIKFKDDLDSNIKAKQDFSDLKLTDASGKEINLSDFIGKSNLVFVVLRGYSNSICPYCSAQMQRIINRFDEIKKLDTDVVIAYPLKNDAEADTLDLFLSKANFRTGYKNDALPLTFGVDLDLKVVDQLGIRADLSKPATYILDKQARLRFAYVGESLADRPSVDAILSQLKQLNAE